jgi:Tfp pilus assembly protein PilP
MVCFGKYKYMYIALSAAKRLTSMQQNSTYIQQEAKQISLNPLQEAEELMNSLFSEVEQTLSIATTNVISSEDEQERNLSYSLTTITKSDTVTIDKPVKTRHRAILSSLPEIELYPESDSSKNKEKNKESVGFIDSLLVGSALTSAIFAVSLALINANLVNANLPSSTSRIQVAQGADLSAPIAEKLRRSLAEIPDPSSQSQQVPMGDRTISKQTSNLLNVIDTPQVKPIYIPIYQLPTATTNTTNPVNLQPPATTTPNIAAVNIPTPNVVTPPKVAPVTPKKSPIGNNTLIGVLDLGDRSSAMIDINGSIQSIKVGNAVGDSGWSVSRIVQQEVILKRGNEDTKVSVGQKF